MRQAEKNVSIVELGYMNGWAKGAFPPEYYSHAENPACEGKVDRRMISMCNNEYTCGNCGVRFSVDSSG